MTLNLNKANAISVSSSSYTKLVRLFVNDARGQFNLNMSANQTIDLDIRSNIKGVFNLSITDGASLFVNGATGYLPDTVKEGFITLVNGNIDGTVYFLENIVTSDGFADGTITITHASKSQMISFIDSDGNKMGDDRLKFGKTEIDGKNYYFATAIPEPAEWAAIFGAIAVGLAVCRRRK